MNPFQFKESSKDRVNWLEHVCRGQLLQELTEFHRKGNHDAAPAFSEAELEHLSKTHQEFSSKDKKSTAWDRASVVAFLKQKSARTLLDLEAAVPLLYKILVNHAAYPFAPDLSASLDFDAMLRAFALLSAKGTESIGGGQGMGGQVLIRKKSDSDNRKMLFRSLAIPIDGTVADTNLDAPDPTADTLEALTCWQFSNRGASASTAPMSRQQLQPRARGLVERRPDIDSMCIPRQGMCELLKFLFTCRFNGSSSNREYLSAPSSEIDQAV